MRWRWHRDVTAPPPGLLSQLLPLLLLLLLMQPRPGFSKESDHGCPSTSVSHSACKEDGLVTVVSTHYEWNADLKRCQKKLQLLEEPCDKAKAKKGICPEPRTVEPGKCNPKSNLVKTLVLHYEPDGKGGCVLRRDYAYPTCPDKAKADADNGCPEPRYFQKPCSGKYRQVFKFYYERSGSKNCVEKSSINLEACGAFVPAKECPSAKEIEPGPCKEGFRTLIRIEYDRDPAGKCVSRSRYVTQACSVRTEDSATTSGCPPNVMKEADCIDGLQSVTKQYYEKTKTGQCVRKFSIENKPCGKQKSGVCPKPRVMEPGPCVDGHTKVLVAHYEPDPVTGKCVEQRSYTTKTCGQSVDGGKPGGGDVRDERCPDTTYSQGPCKEGYRDVFTFTYGYSVPLKRCLKHVALKREQCAAFVKQEACPAEDTVETGPCSDGFRTNIVYHYSRDAAGQCVKSQKKVTSVCKAKPNSDCPSQSERKIGSCSEGIQRYIITYYEFSNLKKRCVKKFKAAEKACKSGSASGESGGSKEDGSDGSGATGGAASKKRQCPNRRVVEPGPCENGSQKVLIEHYEYDEKQARCVARRDFVNKPCGKAAKKTPVTPGIDLKHPCPQQKITQSPCRPEGYRTVTTEYYQYVIGLGRCVKKVKQEEEKCALLVKNSTCPADVTEETGPCSDGFRVDIVFSYVRDAEGRCERKSKKVTMKCKN